MARQVVKYNERNTMYEKAKLREENQMELGMAFHVADTYLNRTYLDSFSTAPILDATRTIMNSSNLRFVEISKLVYDSDEKFIDKLMSVYSTIHNSNSAVALIIDSDGSSIRFYIGIRNDSDVATAGNILESTLRGNFPGIVFNSKDVGQNTDIINQIKGKNIKSISSVSIVPSERNEDKTQESFVQGLEKFIDTMNGLEYTMICLATPLDQESVQMRKHGFEELCSALSPHSKLSVAYGQNESYAVNKSISKNFSESINRSVSNTNSTSTSSSHGTNSGYSSGSSSNFGGGGNGWSFGSGSSSSVSSGSFNSYTSSTSFANTVTEGVSSSEGSGVSRGDTVTTGTSDTVTLTYENKGVEDLIQRAQSQLERFKVCESFGMWEFCSYFMSKDIRTTALAGNAYKALMTGDESNVESAHFNIWSLNQKDNIEKILNNILYLTHPRAEIPALEGGFSQQLVTPTNLVSGNELPIVMGFPKKSISGLAVVEMAEFGRAVVYENKPPKRKIDFGNIYHMGIEESARVNMDLDLLASHCFITGSSGSGKSYATYQLLDQVIKNNVKIMVIEPAKGEYKEIFGGLKGVKIFTTDPNVHRLLRINPFQFPENIHILSHIEQLMQIFSASWSLYAAMPAILKQAIVDSYERCGWDVQNSIWIPGISDHKYPVFADVLKVLPDIINSSDYSADSKGDYKGALLTRVESMTVGMSGLIFKNSEGVNDSILFDSNVIIDLSELGSEEAIALVMGVLTMKLNEYRKSQRKVDPNLSLNSDLRHVTVLEEAHNLLKRTSKDQNQESANMVGKSVEMISNSIKEMRTYGEGFIIIDQSPMAVDSSAIENTATKIIMNTPAKDACEEIGSALSLNDKQTRELSRLNVGVAAVFQKGWLSPVLMKVDMWDDHYKTDVQVSDPGELRLIRGKIAEALNDQKHNKKFSPMELRKLIRESGLPIDKKREFEDIIAKYNDKFPNGQELNRYYFGSLLLDILECSSLFTIIPMDNIPTYSKFEKLDENSEEFSIMMKNFKENTQDWFNKCFESLNFYAVIDDERKRIESIIDALYVMGSAGLLKKYPNSKLAMLYRMICQSFNIPY